MQAISGSTYKRQIGLSGLPAMLLAIAFAVTAGAFVLILGIFGIAIWCIRKALRSLLKLFGANGTVEEIPVMHGRPTIEMRRDENGSWRQD